MLGIFLKYEVSGLISLGGGAFLLYFRFLHLVPLVYFPLDVVFGGGGGVSGGGGGGLGGGGGIKLDAS